MDDNAQRGAGMSAFDWYVVTANSPLRVRRDTEDEAIEITPDTLEAGLQVGDRVRGEMDNRRLIIHGKAK